MATAKKAAAQAASEEQTPAPIAQPRSLEIPADDPGPPPPFPVAEAECFASGYASSLATQLIAQAGHKNDLDGVRVISTLRLNPKVAQFKAEVIHWLQNRT